MTVHTPEPWTIYQANDDNSDFGLAIVAADSHPKLCIAVTIADGSVIRSPDGVLEARGLPLPEALLNAALIAEAPRLLAAAEAVLESAAISLRLSIASYRALAIAVKAARAEQTT